MLKLICVDSAVTYWIDVNGKTFGIVSAFEVLDCDCLVICDCSGDAISLYNLLENSGVPSTQDSESNITTIAVEGHCGEMITLVANPYCVEILQRAPTFHNV